MDLKSLKGEELAQLLNVSSTTLYNMSREEIPLPCFVPPKAPGERKINKRYDWYAVLPWFVDRAKQKLVAKLPEPEVDNLEDAKLRKLVAEAGIVELELLEKQGTYLPASEVEALWVKAIANSRSKLLTAPTVAAIRIYPEMTLAEREAVISDVIHSAMHDMSNLNLDEEDDETL